MPPNGFEVRGAHRDSSAPAPEYIPFPLFLARTLTDVIPDPIGFYSPAPSQSYPPLQLEIYCGLHVETGWRGGKRVRLTTTFSPSPFPPSAL